MSARLKGLICYLDNHWVAFFDGAAGGAAAPPAWLCANDERVFPCEAPLSACAQHRLQPSILFYEAGGLGDRIPADRGRAALHGSADAAGVVG